MDAARFLDIDALSVSYGRTSVLEDIRLAVAEGEFIALLGASGCGKTTLLRTIAGFIRPQAGRVRMAGRDITDRPPDRRDMALVFQSYALWPHMTVRQNIGYGLKVRRVSRAVAKAKVDGILAMLGLDGFGERSVTALSGGQRQRVALGRALAIDPRVLLLDEPLSNLDARIRLTVRHEIRALQRRLGITAIHVTHDREEAMVMADRIVILKDGRIEQAGAPEEVYNHPRTPYIATFLGADNVVALTGEPADGGLRLAGEALAEPAVLPPPAAALADGTPRPFHLHFRSEAAEIVPLGAPAGAPRSGLALVGRVLHASYPGGAWRHAVAVGAAEVLVDAPERHAAGTAVRIRIPPDALFLFPAPEAAPAHLRQNAAERPMAPAVPA